MDNIAKIFGIKKNDVVSIVGAGGKTSLMYYLGNHFPNSLMTTTTKLFTPDNKNLIVGDVPLDVKGSFVIAKTQKENKLYGFEPDELKQFYKLFSYTFIEADGARMKNLKAWKETEPVIPDFSNKTIGVLDIKTLNQKTRETVHRLNELEKITTVGKVITLDNLKDIVLHKKGMFKYSRFKILYINKVESQEHLEYAYQLVKLLMQDDRFDLDRIILGSTFNAMFEVVYNARGNFILASGMSTRMGADKLSMKYKEKLVLEHVLEKLSTFPEDLFLITNNHRFNELAEKYSAEVLVNPLYEEGQSASIKRALDEEYRLYTYFLGDMPNISKGTIQKIMDNKDDLVTCGNKDLFKPPTTLSRKYKNELMMLEGDQGAKKILKKYIDSISFIEVDENELKDIDTKEDLEVL